MRKFTALFTALLMALPLMFSLPPAVLASPTDDYAVLIPVGATPTGVRVQVGETLTDNCPVTAISSDYKITVNLNPCDGESGHCFNQLWQLPNASDLWNGVGAVDHIMSVASAQDDLHEGGNVRLMNFGNEINYFFKATVTHEFWLKFDANGGENAPNNMYFYTDNQYERSHAFVVPSDTPTRDGYTFQGWSKTPDGGADYQPGASVLVSEFGDEGTTVTLYAVWGLEGERCCYKVDHYKENADDNGYTMCYHEEPFGVAGGMTEAVAQTYEGFTAQSFEQQRIDPRGTVINIYYNRNRNTVTYTDGVDDVEVFGDQTFTVKYGAAIPGYNGDTPTREDYVFIGWSPAYVQGATMPDNDLTYTAKWEKADKPEPPSKDDVNNIVWELEKNHGTPGVVVVCGNNCTTRVFGFSYDDSCSIGSVEWSAENGYTVTVTVGPDRYVNQYNQQTRRNHWLNPRDQECRFTLNWDAEHRQWFYAGDTREPIVRITVICEEAEPPKPPNDEDVVKLADDLKAVVRVVCDNNCGSRDFNLLLGTFDVGHVERTATNSYTVAITVHPAQYVERYSTATNHEHWLNPPNQECGFILNWTAERNRWFYAGDTGEPLVLIKVTCDKSKPEPPTDEEIIKLEDTWDYYYGIKAVEVVCGNGCDAISFPLSDSDFSIGAVEGNAADGYTVDVTVDPAPYVSLYSDRIGSPHRLYPAEQVCGFRMNWNAEYRYWFYDGRTDEPLVQIPVICDGSQTEPADWEVQHWWQNIEDDDYEMHEHESVIIDPAALPNGIDLARDYEGFTFRYGEFLPEYLLVRIYYDRQTFTITYKDGVAGETVFADRIFSGTRYGADTPAFGANPERAGYVFGGWEPAVADTVTADATYTARWTPSRNTPYEVHHYLQTLEGDGYELNDRALMVGVTGALTAAAANSYTGFTALHFEQEIIAADGSTVIEIYYDRLRYTVQWKNWNGDVLRVDEDIPYGAMPEYEGETPTRPDDDEYTYTFAGWTPEIDIVTGNATYTAVYTAAPKEAPPVTEPPTDEPPTDEPPTDEPPTDEPPTDEPPTDEPPTDEPPTDEPPTDEPPTDEPPTDEPPTDEPPTDEPPTDEPPTDEPPTDEPPVTEPPTEPHVPSTGFASLAGLGFAAILAGAGITLFRRKKS